ncbi:MAG: 30S ribosomal protein S16 [Candidatus Paceibacterota bacterium]|jgi:small subunit ribosomal protein S16
MLMIRLQRTGRKHVPSFRVVLTDKRNSTKSGRTLEKLGSYNPINDKEKNLNVERIKYWLSKGAQPSGTLHNYLIEQKVITGKKINVLPKKRPIKKEEKPEEKPVPTEAVEKVEKKEEATAPVTETPAKPEKIVATA